MLFYKRDLYPYTFPGKLLASWIEKGDFKMPKIVIPINNPTFSRACNLYRSHFWGCSISKELSLNRVESLLTVKIWEF